MRHVDTRLINGLKDVLKFLDLNIELDYKIITKKKSIVILTIKCDNKNTVLNKCKEYFDEQEKNKAIDFYKIFIDEPLNEKEFIIHAIL